MRHLITPILAATLLTTTGCELLSSIGTSKATRSDSLTMEIPTSGQLLIENSNGSIECLAADVDAISVEAKVTAYGRTDEAAAANLEQVEVVTEDNDGVAELIVKHPRGISGGASLTIKLPRDLSLRLKSKNGAIKVTGVVGGVNASSSNGGIRIADASGDITVKTSNGGVSVGGEKISNLNAETSNGAVGFSGTLTQSSHSISTSNGAVDVKLVGGTTDVTAKTSNGKIVKDGEKIKSGQTFRLGEPDGDDAPIATMKLRTSNGAIRVSMVPSSTKLAKTESDSKAADAEIEDIRRDIGTE